MRTVKEGIFRDDFLQECTQAFFDKIRPYFQIDINLKRE